MKVFSRLRLFLGFAMSITLDVIGLGFYAIFAFLFPASIFAILSAFAGYDSFNLLGALVVAVVTAPIALSLKEEIGDYPSSLRYKITRLRDAMRDI